MTFWPEKFFGSARVQALDGVERGVYLLMLVAEWQFNGQGLPADQKQLRRILGLDSRSFRVVFPSLSCFFRASQGRLYNDRLEYELKVAKEKRQQLSEAGRIAAAVRYGKRPELRSQCHPSPIPSEEPFPNPSRKAGRASSLRAEGKNPRAQGTNPRAQGTNPRAVDPDRVEQRERKRLVAEILRHGYRTEHVSASAEGLEGGAGLERWEEIPTERLRRMLP